MSSVLKVDTIQNTAGTSAITIDSNGVVLTPSTSRPAFHAYLTANQAAGTIVFDDASALNQGSHYNTSTGIFTCPVGGLYNFAANIMSDLDGSAAYFGVALQINGSNFVISQNRSTVDNDYSGNISTIASLSVNDQVNITCDQKVYGAAAATAKYTFFSGYLIG
tara:strand:+ start:449 stop:940 length:492 start_codon:yes stop_codon:yes gene_type:complete